MNEYREDRLFVGICWSRGQNEMQNGRPGSGRPFDSLIGSGGRIRTDDLRVMSLTTSERHLDRLCPSPAEFTLCPNRSPGSPMPPCGKVIGGLIGGLLTRA